MAEYRITSWQKIPTMVTARDAGGATAKVALPDRFQDYLVALRDEVSALSQEGTDCPRVHANGPTG